MNITPISHKRKVTIGEYQTQLLSSVL